MTQPIHPTVKARKLIAAVVLALTAAGVEARAQSAAQTQPASPPPLPSITLPPALDRVLRDYERAWGRGDAAALALLFAEDGFVMQGGRPPVRGRAAIRAAYTGQGSAPLRLRALAASVADTVGYIVGSYGYGEKPEDVGKFTLTLRRTPTGPWLIFSDMDNLSRPPR